MRLPLPRPLVFMVMVAEALVATAGAPRTAAAECPRSAPAVELANAADRLRMVDLSGAIAKYEEALRLEPSDHRIAYKLAMAYIKQQNWSKASETFAKACKLAPTFANYFFWRGYALEQMAGNDSAVWEAARVALLNATELDPNYADAHFDLAEVLLHQGDDRGALAHYVHAIRLKPDQIAFYGPLADLYVRLGFVDAAQQALTEGLAWAPASDGHRFVLLSLSGQVLERKGDRRGAFARYAEARAACGACNERGQQIAFFNVGAVGAQLGGVHKAEAAANLTTFTKMVCRGAAAARYADECTQTQEFLRKLGP